MENLATDSFSYSWLKDKPPPPPSEGLIDNLRRRVEDDGSFHFDVPLVASPTHLVNADEIFSEGQIMAANSDRSRTEAFKTSSSASVPASPLLSIPFLAADRKNPYYILGKWRRSSKKILLKCLGFVVGCSRKSSRVDDLQRKVLEVRSLSNSPTHSSAYSAVEFDDVGYGFDFRDEYSLKIDQNWRSSPNNITSPCRYSSYVCCDADENSIREAILYCKRSIEK